MRRLSFPLTALAMALLFGFCVPLSQLDEVTPTLLVMMAIVVAALLLRSETSIAQDLRSLDPVQRCVMTRRIVERTQAYGRLIGVFSFTMAVLLVLTAVGAEEVAHILSPGHERITVGLIGAALGICLAAVPEIARRDLDILRMQKRLIDAPRKKKKPVVAAPLGDNVVRLATGLNRSRPSDRAPF